MSAQDEAQTEGLAQQERDRSNEDGPFREGHRGNQQRDHIQQNA